VLRKRSSEKGNKRRSGKVKSSEKAQFTRVNEHFEHDFNATCQAQQFFRAPQGE
jgi:hypothetical protein